MKNTNKLRTFLAILLAFLLFLPQTTLVSSALASTGDIDGEAEIITTTEVNELTVRQAVSRYFQGRKAFLTSGDTTAFTGTIPGVVEDEVKHLQTLEAQGMAYESFAIEYITIGCADLYANVRLNETVTYRTNGTGVNSSVHTEVVEHILFVSLDESGELLVASDEYLEEYSQFESCSYVGPAAVSVEPMSTGSGLCIAEIAEGEVGYIEGADDDTKYGEYFGKNGAQWCSMFVTWCARMCNINSSVIPLEAGVPNLRTYYANLGRYYPKNGSATPAVGDLYFQGTSYTSTSHVGIIVAVGATYITIVDGNSGDDCDRVVRRDVKYSNPNFVGFAKPNYTTTTHTIGTTWAYNTTKHWFPCENCGCAAANYLPHDMVQYGSISRCTTCGYTANASVNRFYLIEEQ